MKRLLLRGYNARGRTALVDDKDFDQLSKYKWAVNMRGYAMRTTDNTTILMAREIMGVTKGLQVDHINHDKLDNQKSNLRICSNQQNNWNRQKRLGKRFKGVYYYKKAIEGKKWAAIICKDGKNIFLGGYSTAEEAAKIYDREAIGLFGAYAALNFQYGIE